MKATLILPICFLPLTAFSETVTVHEKDIEKETPTENDLLIKRKQFQANNSGTRYAPPAPTPSVVGSDPQDFARNSDTLCFGDFMILIPKGSIILIPKNLAVRLNVTPKAQLVPWSVFYPANRSWITTFELSPEQAAGTMPVSKDTIDSLAKAGKLVVTIFKGNPISILPPIAVVNPNSTKPTPQP